MLSSSLDRRVEILLGPNERRGEVVCSGWFYVTTGNHRSRGSAGATTAATDELIAVEYTSLSSQCFHDADGVEDWRVVLGVARAAFRVESFPAAAALVVAFTDAAERAVHHPDLAIRYPGVVSVGLVTHAARGLTTLDVDLAREFSVIAARAGAIPEQHEAQAIEFAIDTMDADVIRPFWAAVLGYVDDHGVLVDPTRRGPALWFQQLGQPRPVRNRIHLDVSVAHDVAQRRVDATIAAGGVLVSSGRARAFWVLADADGNEACICTWQDR